MREPGDDYCKVNSDVWDHPQFSSWPSFKLGATRFGCSCLMLLAIMSISMSFPSLHSTNATRSRSTSLSVFSNSMSAPSKIAAAPALNAPVRASNVNDMSRLGMLAREGFQLTGRNLPHRSRTKTLAYHPRHHQRPVLAADQLTAFMAGMDEKFLAARVVRLSGQVTDELANKLVLQMLYLESVDPNKDITMYINSPGGSVTAGMAIFDTMNLIQPQVSTVCAGLAASMGAFLLGAGQKGKRFSLPSSRIMIHQPLGGSQGGAFADFAVTGAELMFHRQHLNEFLSNFTGQTFEQTEIDTDRDFFMSAEEAVEYGLIDAVITSSPTLQEPSQ